MALHFDFPPRLMPGPQAAHYLGVSESKLRTLEIPRRVLDGKRVYHINDLIAYADSLQFDGEGEPNSCDAIFGAKS
ncbi:MAG: DNA-binding protein [Pseudomonadota bacterium]